MKREIEIAAAVACGVLLAFGAGYIWDCRRAGGDVDPCWNTGEKTVTRALDILLGATGGFAVGYWTLNPGLRKEDREDFGVPNQGDKTDRPLALQEPGEPEPHPLSRPARNSHDH
jgi:hypothetical protein